MDYNTLPTPAYILEERLLRKNLELIKNIQDQADIKIIVAFKGFALWAAFLLTLHSYSISP